MNIAGAYCTDRGWDIYENSYNPENLVARGSCYLTGNGYLDCRGTFPDWRKTEYVGTFIAGTYDRADGKWAEVVNAPNALYTFLEVEGRRVPLCDPSTGHGLKGGEGTAPVKTGSEGDRDGEGRGARKPVDQKADLFFSRLNLRSGELELKKTLQAGAGKVLELKVERFASYDDLHLVPMRLTLKALDPLELTLATGIDKETWDLNGKHLPHLELEGGDRYLSARGRTVQSAIEVVVLEGHHLKGRAPVDERIEKGPEAILRRYRFDLRAGDELVLEKYMVVYSSADSENPQESAAHSLEEARGKGYRRLKTDHEPHLHKLWDNVDISIEGDRAAQALLRFNLYQALIAILLHSDRLPVGARGLSCQAYQGAAFWDQEIYNLPMLTYAMPGAARKILSYRYHTLGGARRKASRLGYRGAFYAWVSGKSGDELCPSFFFTDVLTGRKIRNHFDDWQIHVSPDLVYAIWQYYLASGDRHYIEESGAAIIFEVARFLYSHAYYKAEKDRFEFIRLLGPDEYHENVDNNAFTNYMAYFSLRTALKVKKMLEEEGGERYQELCRKLSLTESEFSRWGEMTEKLYLPGPHPHSGLVEQFDGYFELEDTTPEDLKQRLIRDDEYWGWPNGVAVHTQVIKQADVLQLMVLQDHFSEEDVRANYEYYEPCCQHGSSLSPSVHAIIAARLGRVDEALAYFKRSCSILV